MSVRCPSCGMQSPDEAPWCDFCKEPFQKRPKAVGPPASAQDPAAAPADPLAGLSKEQLLELPAERLLKSQDDIPKLPPWFRPLARTFLLVCLTAGAMALNALYKRYQTLNAGPPASPRL